MTIRTITTLRELDAADPGESLEIHASANPAASRVPFESMTGLVQRRRAIRRNAITTDRTAAYA